MAKFFSNEDLRQRQDTKVLAVATVLTAADSGPYILDAAAGKTITLPPLKEGLRYKFIVGAAFATTNFIIKSSEGDNINGIIADMGSTPAGIVAAGEDQINFVASAELVGDYVEFICDFGNSQWLVNGVCGVNGGITATDPA